MTSKYFFHAFIAGRNVDDKIPNCPDAIGVHECDSWEITEKDITTHQPIVNYPRGHRHRFTFAEGNRFYLVENHGQCQEPNGDIIWRNEDGNQGNE